ncbi:MAG: L-threonylcarbamoyladenylate synthase [Bacteroidales bacterium]|jgi:L-threonylcarbamoyladenylate synthase|nr:L-threonylcarbamoyladenylate synthase [Bacteroidales bacterium]
MIKEEINKTCDILHKGGIILYPTDTIWGLGCDANNADAIDKLYKLKQRDPAKSMLVLVEHVSRVQAYVNNPPDVALDMMEISDNPLTIIFDGAKNLPTNLIAEDGSIAIRVVPHGFVHDLIRRFKRPIVSTSANFSGQESPLKYSDIDKNLIEQVDYSVNLNRNNRHVKASSIVRVRENNQIEIIRR